MLIANPSPDVYGSDLQMLESVSAMVDLGWAVVAVLPHDGPLVSLLESRGAQIRFESFPVLRRANASARGITAMLSEAGGSLRLIRRVIAAVGADVVYVNTVTLPWWLLAARLSRTPVICHVHEAEKQDRKVVRLALVAPLVLAKATIVISRVSLTAMCAELPLLRRRAHLVYNGVAGPLDEPSPPVPGADGRVTVCLIARLSPRKAPDVALDAVGILRRSGRDIRLLVCGTAFAGYEWFTDQLLRRSAEPDLAGTVEWLGYVAPIWPVLEQADIALAPSLREPFGNAVVEAQLALRPIIASAAEGHLETISDGVTGLLVPPSDPAALAAAILRLIDDPLLAAALAANGRASARQRFSTERYRQEVAAVVNSVLR